MEPKEANLALARQDTECRNVDYFAMESQVDSRPSSEAFPKSFTRLMTIACLEVKAAFHQFRTVHHGLGGLELTMDCAHFLFK